MSAESEKAALEWMQKECYDEDGYFLADSSNMKEVIKIAASEQWVKVEDELPPDISWVNVNPGNFGWYSNYEKRWLTWNNVQIYPTHWMPLPEKPQV